jgi:hypothetical protein
MLNPNLYSLRVNSASWAIILFSNCSAIYLTTPSDRRIDGFPEIFSHPIGTGSLQKPSPRAGYSDNGRHYY